MNHCAVIAERVDPGPPVGLRPAEPPSLEAVKPEFAAYLARIREMKRRAVHLRITGEASLKEAVALGGEAKRLARLLAEREETVTEAAAGYVKAVRGFVRLIAGALTLNAGKTNANCIEAILKRKISEYRRKAEAAQKRQEKATRKAARALQKKFDAEAHETGEAPATVAAPCYGPPRTVIRTEEGTLGYQVKRWKARITDADEVPREYCSPDMHKIHEAVKSGVRQIPGIRICEETSTRFRV